MRLIQIICLVTPFTFWAQTLDTNYFNNLKSNKVASNPDFEWRQFGPGMSGYCEQFWIHPTVEDAYYMAPDLSNTYATYDNGNSWNTIKGRDENGSNMRRVQDIKFSHQDPNLGYAIDITGDLYRSTDKGRNWTVIEDLIEGRHCEIAVDPSDDNNWYIGAGDFWHVKFYHKSRTSAQPQGATARFVSFGHVYRSTDKGNTWTPIIVDPAHSNDLAIGVIIIDPENSNNLIIATNFGLYRSTNKGASWTSANSTDLPNNYPRDLTYHHDDSDPMNPVTTLIYLEQTHYIPMGNTIESRGGVYTSTDFGNSWTNITGNLGIALGSSSNNDVNPNKVDNFEAVRQYYTTLSRWLGISRTEAQNTYNVLPNNAITTFNRIAVNPNDSDEIYISQNVKHDKGFSPGEVWKTEDGGVNWFPCARYGNYWDSNVDHAYWNTSRNNSFVPDSNTAFAHIQPAINRRPEVTGNRFLEVNKNGDIFICLDQQVMRSTNGGDTWNQVDDFETSPGSKRWIGRGGSNMPGRFLLLDSGVPGRILACSGEHGLWQTVPHDGYAGADDLTVAVEQIEGQVNSGGSHSIASVAVDPNDPNTIYTIQFRQLNRGVLRKSTDGGQTWATVPTDQSNDFVFDEDYSAVNDFAANYKTFNLLINPTNTQRMYFVSMENPTGEVSDGNNVIKGVDLGVRYTFDGGATWNSGNFPSSTNPRSIRRIAFHPTTPSVMYAASNISTQGVLGGLFRSTDSGQNWSQVSIPSEIKSVNHIFLEEQQNVNGFHNMYISCGQFASNDPNEGGVWKSSDNGATWNKIFDMPYIWQTEVSPLNSNIITVSVSLQDFKRTNLTIFNPGAYVSFDGGNTWEKANNNIGQPNLIVDLKPDINDISIFWAAIRGSGWMKGKYRGDLSTLSTASLNQEPFETLRLFPNPAKNEISLSSTLVDINTDSEIEVYALDGSFIEVLPKSTNSSSLNYDISHLASGVYLLSIKTGEGKTYLKKLIKH